MTSGFIFRFSCSCWQPIGFCSVPREETDARLASHTAETRHHPRLDIGYGVKQVAENIRSDDCFPCHDSHDLRDFPPRYSGTVTITVLLERISVIFLSCPMFKVTGAPPAFRQSVRVDRGVRHAFPQPQQFEPLGWRSSSARHLLAPGYTRRTFRSP